MHFNAKAEVGPQSQNELLQPQNNELQQRQKKKNNNNTNKTRRIEIRHKRIRNTLRNMDNWKKYYEIIINAQP